MSGVSGVKFEPGWWNEIKVVESLPEEILQHHGEECVAIVAAVAILNRKCCSVYNYAEYETGNKYHIIGFQLNFTSGTPQKAGPPGPIRSRPVNTAPDKRLFQTPRANMSADNFKLKHVPEAIIHAQKAKIPNIQSKPLQLQKAVQKFINLNMEMNYKILKSAGKQELLQFPKKPSPYVNKLFTKKSPPDVNKLIIQKKKMLTALKTKTAIPLGDILVKTSTAPKTKKITKVMNTQLPIQETIIPQDKTTATQNTKVDNDISSLNNKVQENHIVITKNNSASAEDIKPEDDTPKIKPAPEIVANINADATEEKKLQENEGDNKVPSASLPKKEDAEQPKTEKDAIEKYELDPLLARAVEEELQDIMIQVWKELPDDPIEEGDRIAVEKLRNEAGDDLRRVLGLNITKRLLNVYNNLFIKMQFTCRPQIGCLTSFLKEYHIEKFKRIDKNSNTFAAQLETIEDYDRLCAVKELKCGEAKITLTQCYKFTQCPGNVKTIYDDTYFYEDSSQSNTESEKGIKNNIQIPKVKASNENVVKTDKIVTKPIDKPESNTKSTVPPEIQKNISLEHNDSEDDKKKAIEEPESKSKSIVMAEDKETANLIENDCKDANKESPAINKEATTDSSKIIPEDLESKDSKTQKEKELTDNVTNEKEISEVIVKNKDIKAIIKDKLKSDNIDCDIESDVPECQMDEDDELDDEDILALMSEGVVLDECSGSEEEK